MNQTSAFLELKYGWVYGGSPKFHIVCEAAILIHNPAMDNILIFSKQIRGHGKIVTSFSQTDEFGVTQKRVVEVLDLSTQRVYPFDPNFKLPGKVAKGIIARSYGTHKVLKNFIVGLMIKYKPKEFIIFGGRRDILLCEKAGVRFDKVRGGIYDTQELLKRDTDHLFSLNKISKIIKFPPHSNRIESLNYEYYLPRHITRNLAPNSATYDLARAFLVHQEFVIHKQNLLIKAALQLQKIEQTPKG